MLQPAVPRLSIALALVAIVAAACGSASESEIGEGSAGRGVVAGTNTDLRSVPLDEVVFDTFDGGSIPLSEVSESRVLDLRDRIRPLDEPVYEPAVDAGWLNEGDLVLGYEPVDGSVYAYPIRIMNFHEIVNDELGGVPVLVSYCPLCRSGIVYDRRVDGRTLSFGNTSALYESDLVMFDRETLAYWFQVGGEAIVGELTGTRMEVLPATTTTWAEWLRAHPDTLVLSRDTGYAINYDRDPFVGLAASLDDGRYPFPVSEAGRDGRLSAGTVVLGVEVGGDARAYAVRGRGLVAINDRVGDEAIVVFGDEDEGSTINAFRPAADGRELSFAVEDGRIVDEETGSEWALGGEAISGPLEGERLEQLPARTTFWFAYVAALPHATVYEP